jgi:hypothetical protein
MYPQEWMDTNYHHGYIGKWMNEGPHRSWWNIGKTHQ